MRDLDELKDLKRTYMDLVRIHGETVAEYQAFRQSLLDMNRRHRREAVGRYVRIISRVEKKVGRRD